MNHLACDDVREHVKHFPLPVNLGERLIWISLMECLDQVGCMCKVFRWFPAHFIRGVVKSLPLDKLEQAWTFATMVELAVDDPTNFPLVRIVQLNWWRWVNCSVGISLDLVGCSSDTWKTG